MIIEILAIIFLLVVAAFFSAAETSLTASSRSIMHKRAKEGDHRAKLVMKLKNNSESVLSSILLGNNVVGILATALATLFLTKRFSEDGVIYATVIMTVATVIFCEVLPKSLSMQKATPVALLVAPVVRAWLWITWPVIWSINLIMGLMGTKNSFPVTLEEEELRGAIDLHGENTHHVKVATERTMLQSILDLDDVTVDQVMRHRKGVFMLDATLPLEEIVRQVIKSPYTRVPVWQGDPSNIIGILHTKTLLQSLDTGTSFQDIPVVALLKQPWFIPENANLLQQLQEFKKRREHIAIVIDEYGAFLGIITLEDILEEIVGDIADELDAPTRGWRQEEENRYLINGAMTIRDINRDLGFDLPEDNSTTLAGFLMYESRAVPNVGQKFVFFGYSFEIIRRKNNQITLIRAEPTTAITQ